MGCRPQQGFENVILGLRVPKIVRVVAFTFNLFSFRHKILTFTFEYKRHNYRFICGCYFRMCFF